MTTFATFRGLDEKYEGLCDRLDALTRVLERNLATVERDESFRHPLLAPPEHQTYEFSVATSGFHAIVDPRPTPTSVVTLVLVSAGTVTVRFGSGTTDFEPFRSVSGYGGMPLVAQSVLQLVSSYPSALFNVPAGQGFGLSLSDSIAVSGFVTFYQTETTRAAAGV